MRFRGLDRHLVGCSVDHGVNLFPLAPGTARLFLDQMKVLGR